MRAQFLSFREREFVLAARAIGASHGKVIFKEILPNAVPPALVVASILVARAILLEAGLSFLGLRRPQSRELGILVERGSGTPRRLRLAGAISGPGDIVAGALRQSFRRRDQRCSES